MHFLQMIIIDRILGFRPKSIFEDEFYKVTHF